MKKIALMLMIVVLIFVCCSCGEEHAFVEGNLLYDLGAKSFEDIEKVGFWYEEYQGDYENKIEITQKKDIELLLNYKYSSDYPADKLHELFIYPTNSIYVTIKGIEYQLCLGEGGALTTVPSNNMNRTRTYTTEKGKGFTDSVWEQIIQKYQ